MIISGNHLVEFPVQFYVLLVGINSVESECYMCL